MRVLERRVDLRYRADRRRRGRAAAASSSAPSTASPSVPARRRVVLVLALIASYLAGARVSAPLRRMAHGRRARRRGRPRAADGGLARAATRCTVLADAFNHMLDRLADAFASQREFIADASHELRTPLTVIRGQLEVLAAQEHPPEAEVRRVERLVQAEITRISRLVDDLLLLAQAEQADFLRPEQIDLRAVRRRTVGRAQPDRRPPVRARAGPRRHARGRPGPARPGAAQPRPQRDRAHRRAGRPRAARGRRGDARPAPVHRDRRRARDPRCRARAVFERFHRTDAGRDAAARRRRPRARDRPRDRRGPRRRGPRRRAPNGAGARVELVLPGFVARAAKPAVPFGQH